MEKKYYIIPSIKVKEIEVESLMAGESLETVTDGTTVEKGEESLIQSKPMYGDFNVWEK